MKAFLLTFPCIYLTLTRLPVVFPEPSRAVRTTIRSGAVLLAEASGLDGEMGLVLEARILACGQERDSLGDRAADGLDPARLRFGEVVQDIIMDERLVAGTAETDPHPFIAPPPLSC